MHKKHLITGSILGLLAVSFGAFGAHALEEILLANEKTKTYDTAVQYHVFHTLAIFVTAILMRQNHHRLLHIANLLFTAGVVLFSGSLYVLSLTNLSALGAITPIGGLCFMAGWLILIFYFARFY